MKANVALAGKKLDVPTEIENKQFKYLYLTQFRSLVLNFTSFVHIKSGNYYKGEQIASSRNIVRAMGGLSLSL